MVKNKIKALEAARAKIASLEQSIAHELSAELAALPAKYGFDSAKAFAAAVKAAGKPVEAITGLNYVHMETVESLANPYGLAGRAALKMMKL